MRLEDSNPNTLNIFCDGGARGNPGPAAIGFVVKDSLGKTLHRYSERIGNATNNIAEYQAVIAALGWITKYEGKLPIKKQTYKFYLDSRLVVNQLNGKFKIKDEKLKSLVIKVRKLERIANLISRVEEDLFSEKKSRISYNLVPRTQNSEADALVNHALNNFNAL
jgi:ribonuclease HI